MADPSVLDLVQTAAIVFALIVSALALRAIVRTNRAAAALDIANSHRQLFLEALKDPELARVLEDDAEAASVAITPKERLFTTLLFIHIYTVFRLHKEKLLSMPREWYTDIAEFALLPVPRAVWEDVRRVQDKEFVRFVEDAVRRAKAGAQPERAEFKGVGR